MKRCLILLAAAALLLALLGCGSGGTDSGTDPGGAFSSEQENEGEEKYLLAEMVSCEMDGSVSSRQVYEYDADGLLTAESIYGPGGELTGSVQYTYEEDPQGLKRIGTGNAAEGRTETILDSMGRELQNKSFDENGNCSSWTQTDYDAEGRILHQRALSEDGTILNGWDSTFDAYGNELTRVTYGAEGEVLSSIEYRYTYDGNGNALSAEIYNYGTHLWTLEYTNTYDEAGTLRRAEILSSSGGNTIVKTYNESGRLIDEEGISGGLSFHYTYNDAGKQLLNKAEYSSGGGVWIEYRYIIQ